MPRLLFFLLSFLLINSAHSSVHKYFIRFTDKNGSAYSVNNPSAFLSQRAIERRTKQNISIVDEDLPVNSNYIDSLIAHAATIFTRSKWFNGVTIECDSSVLPSLLALPFVMNASKVFRTTGHSVHKEINENLPLNQNSEMMVTVADYGSSYSQIHQLNAEFLHEDGYTGDGMLIALLDAGFRSVDQMDVFDSLRNLNHIVTTWDFVANESSVYEDDTHGMEVLSTIAGNIPGSLIGTAPHASFLLLRSEDAPTENIIEEYNWDAAAEFADSAGADVISSSLGYTQFDDTSVSHVYADMNGHTCPASIAANKAFSKGMLVLTSAGNSGNDNWHYISAPSDGDSVLSIGAVDANGHHADFSSWGPASDGDIKPNVCSKGYAATVADLAGGVALGSGTSFSCPIMAGAATCLWQAYPQKTARQIKKAIERSANYYFSPNDSLGYGIPDFRIAGFYLATGDGTLPLNDEIIGIYPNPFTDNLNIRFYSATTQNVLIELINSVGQVVSSKNETAYEFFINSFSISAENFLSKGIYFVRIKAESESYVRKVFKY